VDAETCKHQLKRPPEATTAEPGLQLSISKHALDAVIAVQFPRIRNGHATGRGMLCLRVAFACLFYVFLLSSLGESE